VVGPRLVKSNGASLFESRPRYFLTRRLRRLPVDADLAEESAKLQSLQIKQQLGVQPLAIANAGPQSILALFQ